VSTIDSRGQFGEKDESELKRHELQECLDEEVAVNLFMPSPREKRSRLKWVPRKRQKSRAEIRIAVFTSRIAGILFDIKA
jgi:hypothetical protein